VPWRVASTELGLKFVLITHLVLLACSCPRGLVFSTSTKKSTTVTKTIHHHLHSSSAINATLLTIPIDNMPPKFGGAPSCPRCSKAVYMAEQVHFFFGVTVLYVNDLPS
jgi:hypothetical protein